MSEDEESAQVGGSKKRKIFQCDHINTSSGQACTTTSTKAGNIKRHKSEVHIQKEMAFIPYVPGSRPRRGRPPRASAHGTVRRLPESSHPCPSPSPSASGDSSTELDRPVRKGRLFGVPSSSASPTSSPPPDHDSSGSSETLIDTSRDPASASTTPLPEVHTTRKSRSTAVTSTTSERGVFGADVSGLAAPPPPTASRSLSPTTASSAPTAPANSRSSSAFPAAPGPPQIHPFGRVVDSRFNEPVPPYEVKQSKKIQHQQRGLDWLTSYAKICFEETRDRLLNQWGVKSCHRGTCILIPEDWRASDPSTLMAVFNGHNYPSQKSRAWYSFADHATTLVRAAVWFDQWPRRGVDLDAFLSCGPWKPMDASHLCHHDHCIVHATYEPAHVNADRANCLKRARFLRQEKRAVPEICDQHDPPCLLQHAALTTIETCHIQFCVLRQAKGLPPCEPVPRPRRYIYPTFESGLPCKLSAVRVDPTELVAEVPVGQKAGRPDIFCKYCDHIKSYASIVGFWSHIVNKHTNVEDQDRLHEIRRTAALWRIYWEHYSDGGKRGNPTQAKLEQIEADGFGWDDVLAWKLR